MSIIELYIGLILLGFLLSIPHFFRRHNYVKEHKSIFTILCLAISLETTGFLMARNGKINVHLYNIFFVYLETLLILFFFLKVFHSEKEKIIIKASMLVFATWGLVYALFIENIYTFHSISFSIGSFMIILFSIYYFFRIFIFEIQNLDRLSLNPIFWLMVLIFLFYATTFLYFSSFLMVIELDKEFSFTLGYLVKIMAMTMYLGMGLVFYLPILSRINNRQLT